MAKHTGYLMLDAGCWTIQYLASSVLIVIAFSFAIAFIFPTSTASAGANVALIGGEWVHFALWRLEANGITGPIFASNRPYGREEIAQIIASIIRGIEDGSLNPSPMDLELVNKLEAEFARDLRPEGLKMRGSFTGEARYHDEWAPSSASLWGAASFHPTPGVTLYEEIDVGRGRDITGEEGETASRRTKPWKWDYTADFRRAYISSRWTSFEALLGRQSLFWGPGYGGSLILSDDSPAFDMVLLNARFGHVKATAFSAVLDKMWCEQPYRYLANRYLSGHRVDWVVNDRIELGLSELVLYGGEARGIELYYVNPLLPYYASQWNSERDDNVLVSADFAIRPIDKLKVYGQFLVDDFSYAGDDPNALGYIAGLYLSDPLEIPGADFRAEYTRVNSYTYTHLETENQFTHYGWLIGHNLGPDADQVFVEMSQMMNVDTRVKLIYTSEREGSRTVADRFRGEDYKQMDFPSGIVERRHKIQLNFLWEPLRGPQVNVSCASVFVHRQHNSTRKGELSITAGFLSGIR